MSQNKPNMYFHFIYILVCLHMSEKQFASAEFVLFKEMTYQVSEQILCHTPEWKQYVNILIPMWKDKNNWAYNQTIF